MIEETILDKLKLAHADELADVKKYRAMSQSMIENFPEASGILCDIADEEETHVELIKHILSKIS